MLHIYPLVLYKLSLIPLYRSSSSRKRALPVPWGHHVYCSASRDLVPSSFKYQLKVTIRVKKQRLSSDFRWVNVADLEFFLEIIVWFKNLAFSKSLDNPSQEGFLSCSWRKLASVHMYIDFVWFSAIPLFYFNNPFPSRLDYREPNSLEMWVVCFRFFFFFFFFTHRINSFQPVN